MKYQMDNFVECERPLAEFLFFSESTWETLTFINLRTWRSSSLDHNSTLLRLESREYPSLAFWAAKNK
jgi:hypothetical protein